MSAVDAREHDDASDAVVDLLRVGRSRWRTRGVVLARLAFELTACEVVDLIDRPAGSIAQLAVVFASRVAGIGRCRFGGQWS
jgi:hypothetical protein